MSDLLTRKNLTRWNRAGLNRFRYIDANAISYLETLRLSMGGAFTYAGENQWQDLDTLLPVANNESQVEKQHRWKKQYQSERRDYAWEILRAYARASHVLTEHCDAYANEKMLRTASQWQNVKRLVALLDYHPSPPASAQTPIVLLAKADKSGRVDAGFAFKNKPSDGSKPVIFETLDDIDVDYSINTLSAKDWNKSFEPIIYDAVTDIFHFPIERSINSPVDTIAVGNICVLLVEQSGSHTIGLPVKIISIEGTLLQLNLLDSTLPIPNDIYRHQVSLLMQPKFLRKTQLSGANVAILEPDHGLSVGAAMAWKEGATWQAAFVLQIEVNRVRLSRTAPVNGTEVYSTAYSERTVYEINGSATERIIMPTHKNDERIYGADWDENLNDIGSHSHASDGGTYLYDYIDGTAYNRIYYVPDVDPISSVVESQPSGLSFDGKAGKLVSGDWLIAQTSSDTCHALSIVSIDQQADSFSLSSTPPRSADTVLADFSLTLRPANYDQNKAPLFLTDLGSRSDHHSVIPLDAIVGQETLLPGRMLLIAGKNSAMEVEIKSIDLALKHLTVTPAIPGSESSASGMTDNYTRYDSTIYGNVCRSGHGETQSEKVLGSGDATQSNQTFLFDKQEISFVSDGQFPAGVRADITINVEGRTWQQVYSLNHSLPEDPHYIVRMREEGNVDIIFGDGIRARRLPSGNNNIRISMRKGTGLSGNVASYQLIKEVKPNSLVDSLVQPIVASGGNNMESAEAMRENAPASVLTLERAVSLNDFIHLAKSNSSVWDAAAISVPPGFARNDKITLAIVPAGGGSLGSLHDSLKSFLLAHALPRIAISVQPYRAIIPNINITISVKAAEYDPEVIADHVKEILRSDFSLEKRSLGKTLYRSDLLSSVESVDGVENCQCSIDSSGFIDEQGMSTDALSLASGGGGEIRRVTPAWDQVIYIAPVLSNINITSHEFSV